MNNEIKENRAKDQAKSQLESIIAMVERLEHCQNCNNKDCELTDTEIYKGLNLYYDNSAKVTEEDRENYHNEDGARQVIEEDPLSIEIRLDWHSIGDNKDDIPVDYQILLCTGGPAVRIIGKLNRYKQPENAKLEYQDWFTPWIRYNCNYEEYQALLSYVQCFYFGE